MKKILLTFMSCHDTDGGHCKLASLEEAVAVLPEELRKLVPPTAQTFEYKEYGEDSGDQVTWADEAEFDWYDDLRTDEARSELHVDGQLVWTDKEEDEE